MITQPTALPYKQGSVTALVLSAVEVAELIPLTIPLDRPEPQPQQSPGRLELEPQPGTESIERNFYEV